jgi:hypothetical protein
MNKCFFVSLLVVSFLFVNYHGYAQKTPSLNKDTIKLSKEDKKALQDLEDSLNMLLPKKSYFQASIGYLNNNVYLGRKDSSLTPYITPSFGYYHKSGLFINLSASYLASAGESRIDVVTAEAGYSISKGNFDGELTGAKFWYNSSSYNVRSEVKGSVSFYGSYDLGFIKPTVSPSVNIGDKSSDIALILGLEHSFTFSHDAFEIIPTVTGGWSTQNYYNSYYKKRKFVVKRKGVTSIVNGTRTGVVLNASQFKMLDYEFTLPINYTVKKFTFNFSPAYAMPVNPAVVVVTTTRVGYPTVVRTFTETLENSFYFQASIAYKF